MDVPCLPRRLSIDSNTSANSNHASPRPSHDSTQHSRFGALSVLFKKRLKQTPSPAGSPNVGNIHSSLPPQFNDTESNMTSSNVNTTTTAAISKYAISTSSPMTVTTTAKSTPRALTTGIQCARRIYVPKYAARSHASNLAPECSEPPSGRTSNLGTAVSPLDMEQLLRSCGQIEKDRWVNEYREESSRMSRC